MCRAREYPLSANVEILNYLGHINVAARVVKEDWLCQFLDPPRLVVLVKGLESR